MICRVLRKGFSNFVGHDEGGFVLAIKITGKLQRAMAFCSIHEDGDGQEIIADRQLAAGKDCAGRDAELMRAALALEQWTALVFVYGNATAPGANRRTVRRMPADFAEGIACLVIRKPSNPS